MFYKTLASRSANSTRRYSGSLLFIAGLFNPNDKTMRVLSCPENPSIVGKTMPVEASRGNINNAMEYAKSINSAQVRNALDIMLDGCRMAKAKQTEPDPQMLFFLPSAYISNNKIQVHMTGFSCRAPEFNGNDNIRFPVYGFAACEAFVLSVIPGATTQKSNLVYDSLNYFVNTVNPKIHEGFLSDNALCEALAAEAEQDSLLKSVEGRSAGCKNADLALSNNVSAVKVQLCLRDRPDIAVYGTVVSLHDFMTQTAVTAPGDIAARIAGSVAFKFGEDEASRAEIASFIKNEVYVRCVSGFRVHEMLTDLSERNAGWSNQRLQAPLVENCARLYTNENNTCTCLPPLKRIEIEPRRLLQTIRGLTMQVPTGNNVCYPLGNGLVSIRVRPRKNGDGMDKWVSLEAGFLNHKAEELHTRYWMQGTVIDLTDQGLVFDEILPMLRKDPAQAATECVEISNGLEKFDIKDIEAPVNESVEENPEVAETFPSEDAGDDLPF